MRFRNGSGAAVFVLTLLLFGCRDSAPPVAELAVEPHRLEMTYPGFLNLKLSWRLKSELGETEGDPLVFVHLLDEPGSVLRTFDHRLKFDWKAGRTQDYEIKLYQSGLAPPLAAGDYHLTVGLYDIGGKRWPLAVEGAEVDQYEYTVANVSVLEDSGDVPMFYFSSAWLGLEGGTDRQILGRRWLSGEGTIRVAEIPAAGSIWMLVRIPELESEVDELNLEEGAEQPAVLISSACSSVEISATGFGTHEIEVLLGEEGSEPPEECELTIKPNFYILKLDTLARRSVALDVLAWAHATE